MRLKAGESYVPVEEYTKMENTRELSYFIHGAAFPTFSARAYVYLRESNGGANPPEYYPNGQKVKNVPRVFALDYFRP